MQQEQFLNVLDRDEAERRFHLALDLRPLSAEQVPLSAALGRVLACDVVAPLDVPGFDRSNVDGFAVRAEDTFGASEERPRILHLTGEVLATGVVPKQAVGAGQATVIATGAVVPRGADAIVMVEHTDAAGDGSIVVRRPVTPGANLSFAGTDIGRGETVLWRGEVLTSRETGVLAALGVATVPVVRRPRVAIISTGNEIIAPGQPLRHGLIYDSNATIVGDAVRELGGEPVPYGIVPDEREALATVLRRALDCDVVLLSGGTSKGEGDISYRVVAELGPPSIVAHGVALKPGKPLCLAAVRCPSSDGKSARIVPVVLLPGFPTSAIFPFHDYVRPVVLRLAGRRQEPSARVAARLPLRVNSERGRTEFLLVGLVEQLGVVEAPKTDSDASSYPSYVAYPMGKGSGSVTTFSKADGFVVIPRQQEYVEAGTLVEVHLLSHDLRPADLVVIGSHCVGLDYLLGVLQERGFRTKFLAVGSTAGLDAAKRSECDAAGIHLLDPLSNQYNRPFVPDDCELIPGYGRVQGIVFRPGDPRFAGRTADAAVAAALADPSCVLVNRNRGSGTRILLDGLLRGATPPGYWAETHSHNAVAAAVVQGRADWGLAIANVARSTGLGFLPLREERYDFVIPRGRLQCAAVRGLCDILVSPQTRKVLVEMGFCP